MGLSTTDKDHIYFCEIIKVSAKLVSGCVKLATGNAAVLLKCPKMFC